MYLFDCSLPVGYFQHPCIPIILSPAHEYCRLRSLRVQDRIKVNSVITVTPADGIDASRSRSVSDRPKGHPALGCLDAHENCHPPEPIIELRRNSGMSRRKQNRHEDGLVLSNPLEVWERLILYSTSCSKRPATRTA